MKIFIFIIFLVYLNNLSGQLKETDTIFYKKNLSLINTEFLDLDSIKYLDTNRIFQNNARSLAMIAFFQITLEDSLLINSLLDRLSQISKRHYENGTPIIIIHSGMNSIEKARQLNIENDSPDLFYLSFGNSCLSTDLFEKGIERFNKTTMKLIENKN